MAASDANISKVLKFNDQIRIKFGSKILIRNDFVPLPKTNLLNQE
jgi:hypothetical protein